MTTETNNHEHDSILIYRHQLDDHTTIEPENCACTEQGYPTEPAILTPRPDKNDTVELRCGDCGEMWTELYWSNLENTADKRERAQ